MLENAPTLAAVAFYAVMFGQGNGSQFGRVYKHETDIRGVETWATLSFSAMRTNSDIEYETGSFQHRTITISPMATTPT